MILILAIALAGLGYLAFTGGGKSRAQKLEELEQLLRYGAGEYRACLMKQAREAKQQGAAATLGGIVAGGVTLVATGGNVGAAAAAYEGGAKLGSLVAGAPPECKAEAERYVVVLRRIDKLTRELGLSGDVTAEEVFSLRRNEGSLKSVQSVPGVPVPSDADVIVVKAGSTTGQSSVKVVTPQHRL